MKIARNVLDAIADDARGAMPAECCGILLAGGGDPATVTRALRADNAERSRPDRGYVLGHDAHIEAVRMEAAGDSLIAGYYHSHPHGAARPSQRDKDRAVEGVTYLIVGLAGDSPRYAAWRAAGADFAREPLEVSE